MNKFELKDHFLKGFNWLMIYNNMDLTGARYNLRLFQFGLLNTQRHKLSLVAGFKSTGYNTE